MIMPTVDVLEPPSRVSDSSGQLSWAQKSQIAPVLSNLEVRPCPPSCLVPASCLPLLPHFQPTSR